MKFIIILKKPLSSWLCFCIWRVFSPILFPMNMWRRETLSNQGKKWARLLRNTLHSKSVIKMEPEESEDQIFSRKLSWIILDQMIVYEPEKLLSLMPSNQVIPASGNNNRGGNKQTKKASCTNKVKKGRKRSFSSVRYRWMHYTGRSVIQSSRMFLNCKLKGKNSNCTFALESFRDFYKQPKILFLITLNILFWTFPTAKVKCFFNVCAFCS